MADLVVRYIGGKPVRVPASMTEEDIRALVLRSQQGGGTSLPLQEPRPSLPGGPGTPVEQPPQGNRIPLGDSPQRVRQQLSQLGENPQPLGAPGAPAVPQEPPRVYIEDVPPELRTRWRKEIRDLYETGAVKQARDRMFQLAREYANDDVALIETELNKAAGTKESLLPEKDLRYGVSDWPGVAKDAAIHSYAELSRGMRRYFLPPESLLDPTPEGGNPFLHYLGEQWPPDIWSPVPGPTRRLWSSLGPIKSREEMDRFNEESRKWGQQRWNEATHQMPFIRGVAKSAARIPLYTGTAPFSRGAGWAARKITGGAKKLADMARQSPLGGRLEAEASPLIAPAKQAVQRVAGAVAQNPKISQTTQSVSDYFRHAPTWQMKPDIKTQTGVAAVEGALDESIYGGGPTGAFWNSLWTAGPHWGSQVVASKITAAPKVDRKRFPQWREFVDRSEELGIKLPPSVVMGDTTGFAYDSGVTRHPTTKDIVEDVILRPNAQKANQAARELAGVPPNIPLSEKALADQRKVLGKEIDRVMDPDNLFAQTSGWPDQNEVDDLLATLKIARENTQIAPVSTKMARWEKELDDIFYKEATDDEMADLVDNELGAAGFFMPSDETRASVVKRLKEEGAYRKYRPEWDAQTDQDRRNLLERLFKHREKVNKEIDKVKDFTYEKELRKNYLDPLDDLIEGQLSAGERAKLAKARAHYFWASQFMAPGMLDPLTKDINATMAQSMFYQPSGRGLQFDQKMADRASQMSPNAEEIFGKVGFVHDLLTHGPSNLATNQRIGHFLNPENIRDNEYNPLSTDPYGTRTPDLNPLNWGNVRRFYVEQKMKGSPYNNPEADVRWLPAGSEEAVRATIAGGSRELAKARSQAYDAFKESIFGSEAARAGSLNRDPLPFQTTEGLLYDLYEPKLEEILGAKLQELMTGDEAWYDNPAIKDRILWSLAKNWGWSGEPAFLQYMTPPEEEGLLRDLVLGRD